MPRSRIKACTGRSSDGCPVSNLAYTTKISASGALVMKVLVPLIMYPSLPSGTASDFILPKASEPAPGSVRHHDPIFSKVIIGRAYSRIWRAVPLEPKVAPKLKARPGLTRLISFMRIINIMGSPPVPPVSSAAIWAISIFSSALLSRFLASFSRDGLIISERPMAPYNLRESSKLESLPSSNSSTLG